MIRAELLSPRVLLVTGDCFDEHMTAVETGHGLFIVDTLANARATGAALKLIREFSAAPVRMLVNTHYDPDHNAGNQCLAEALIAGHSQTRLRLAEFFFNNPQNAGDVREAIAGLRQQAAAEPDPRRRAELQTVELAYQTLLEGFDGYRFTPPTLFVDGRLTFLDGETEIEIRSPGTAHSDADLFILLKREKILLCGDLLLGRGWLPVLTPPGSLPGLTGALEEIETREKENCVLVPGHGPAGGADLVAGQLEYCRQLSRALRDYRDQRKEAPPGVDSIPLPDFAEYRLYHQVHAQNIMVGWRELTGGNRE